MRVHCSISNPFYTIETDNNLFFNSIDPNALSNFNLMIDMTISLKNNYTTFPGLLSFVRELHDNSNPSIGLKGSKDFTDMLRMLNILDDPRSNPITISNEIYSIKGMSLVDLSYIIENNQGNIPSGLRTFIRKKKLEEIMKNA